MQSIDFFFGAISQSINLETIRWHHGLGHINFQSLNKMQNQLLVLGFCSIKISTSNLCIGCIMGKHSMSNFPKHSFTQSFITFRFSP